MHRKILGFIFCIVLTAGFSTPMINAQEISHSLVLQTSSLPEAKLGYVFGCKFPFMQGDSPLTEDNNIKLNLTAEVSPISLNGLAVATWTPIAFLEFSAGGRIGTGWSINLFGNDLYGLGKTQSGTNDKFEVVNAGGLHGKALVSGAFQFDLAAVVPGDWNHIVFRTYHEINYAGFSGAAGNESWIFEHDDGINVNGFKYYANALIGYQMPIFLNMAALLAEMELPLYNIPGESAWGGDLPQWTFSCILNFAVHKQFDITLLTQFRTRKNYSQTGTEKDYYYRELNIDKSNPLRVEFYRIAAVVTYKF